MGMTTEYFGGCPHCMGSDGFLNIGRDHWGICRKHQAKWYIGSNLFSGWRDETEEDWLRNSYKIAGYRQVEPIFPAYWTASANKSSAKIISFPGAARNSSLVGRVGCIAPVDPDGPDSTVGRA